MQQNFTPQGNADKMVATTPEAPQKERRGKMRRNGLKLVEGIEYFVGNVKKRRVGVGWLLSA